MVVPFYGGNSRAGKRYSRLELSRLERTTVYGSSKTTDRQTGQHGQSRGKRIEGLGIHRDNVVSDDAQRKNECKMITRDRTAENKVKCVCEELERILGNMA